MKQLYNRSLSHPLGSGRRGRNKGVDRRSSAGYIVYNEHYVNLVVQIRRISSAVVLNILPRNANYGFTSATIKTFCATVAYNSASKSLQGRSRDHRFLQDGKTPSVLQFCSNLLAIISSKQNCVSSVICRIALKFPCSFRRTPRRSRNFRRWILRCALTSTLKPRNAQEWLVRSTAHSRFMHYALRGHVHLVIALSSSFFRPLCRPFSSL